MGVSSAQWLSELDMDDYGFAGKQISTGQEENFQQSLSSGRTTSYPSLNSPGSSWQNTISSTSKETLRTSCDEMLTNFYKATSCPFTAEQVRTVAPKASFPLILSFDDQEMDIEVSGFDGNTVSEGGNREEETGEKNRYGLGINNEAMAADIFKRVAKRARAEHTVAERKRREKLSQMFIALSTIIPGLKKIDKASVLEDAIKYIKQLQERVKTLENEVAKKLAESTIEHSLHEYEISTCSQISSSSKCPLEVEVKISEEIILMTIQCENQKGALVKALSEIEKLHVTIICSTAMEFSASSLIITVIAQIDEEYSKTVNDVVNELYSALSR